MSNFQCSIVSGAAPITQTEESQVIILKMPILVFNPYNNQRDLSKHFSKYRGMIPRPHPTNYVHDCKINEYPLLDIDGESVRIRIYEHRPEVLLEDSFLRRFLRFILNRGELSLSTRFSEKYLIMIAAQELYLKTKQNYMNWFPIYLANWLKQHQYTAPFNHVFATICHCVDKDPFVRSRLWPIPSVFKCMCDYVWNSHMEAPYGTSDDEYDDKVEATAFLTDWAKSIVSVSAGAFYSLRAGSIDLATISNDLVIDLTHLVSNFNIKTVIWAFVKAINRIFNVPNIFRLVIDYFKICFDYLKSKVVSPQQTSETVESTADIVDQPLPDNITDTWFESYFGQMSDSAPILCSAMATVLVLVTSLCMGYNIMNEKAMLTRSRLRRVTEAFSQVSKLGTSIKNLYKILVEWPKWVKQIVYECLHADHSQLDELLMKSEAIDPPNMERRTFFSDVAFVCNPTNIVCINKSEEHKSRVQWVHNILWDMAKQLAEMPAPEVKPQTSKWVSENLMQVRRTLTALSRCPSQAPHRFIPFWINLIGNSGLGKSTLAPKILDLIKNLIKRDKDIKDTIPEENSMWCYPMNFCSKYMTGYNGQYCVLIDDLFQDSAVTGDATPSALLLIQMVSSVPFPTIQAAIDDKGIEFTSKIILSTSNDYHIARKEIVDSNALLRRMNVRVHMRSPRNNESQVLDSLLKQLNHPFNVIFDIYNSNGSQLLHSFQLTEFCAYVASQYKRWHVLQQNILGSTLSSAVNVEKLLQIIDSDQPLTDTRGGGSYVPNPKEVKVEETKEPSLESVLDQYKYCVQQPLYILNTTSDGKVKKNLFGHPTFVKNPESQVSVESTASIKCSLFGRPAIKKVPLFVPYNDSVESIEIEQFDCDCDKCIGYNNSFRSHRMEAFLTSCDIVEIKQFVASLAVVADNITQDHINRSESLWKKVLDIIKNVATHPLTIIVTSVSLILAVYYSAEPVKGYFRAQPVIDSTALAYSSGATARRLAPKIKVKNLEPVRFVQATNNTNEISPIQLAIPNTQAYDLICKRILGKQHMCVLQARVGGQMMSNTALRISGTCLLSNDHFFSVLEDGAEFTVEVPNAHIGSSTVRQILNKQNYVRLSDMDAGVYKCDNSLNQVSDLTKHFVDYEVPDQESQAIMVSIYDPHNPMTPVVIPGVTAKPLKERSVIYNGQYSTVDTFVTDVPVHKGQSGSLLISTNSRTPPKIMGILVCRSANSQRGFFKPISKTTLVHALEILSVDRELASTIEEDIEVTSCVAEKPYNDVFDHKNLNYLGIVGRHHRVSQTMKTNFVPSLIQDGNITHEPSVLSPYDNRMDVNLQGQHVIYRSIKGFQEEIGPINTYQLDIAVKELSLEYQNLPDPPLLKRQLLRDYDMINGVKPFLKKVDLRTSPGYPYIKQKSHGEQGKRKWFDEIVAEHEQDGTVFQMTPNLKAIVDEREIKARNGQKSSTVAYMCLKDELRPIAKIKSGSTRVFTCMPMDYNLLIRKYFGAFIIMLHYNAARKVSSCVGINPAKDWYELRMRLCEKNGVWEDFDYKNWDQHLHPELVMRVADLVNAWYGDDHNSPSAKARRVLLYDLVHTTVIVKDYLFVKRTGQCSGCAITAELNCVVHEILLYYVYRLHQISKGLSPNLTVYRKEVACAIYGDDIIKSTIPESDFVGSNIKPYMDHLGMNITPGDKVSTNFTLKTPEQIQFLKRTFTIDRSIASKLESHSSRAPLNEDIVANIPQWIRKSEDPKEATLTNCNTALREYFMYGKEEFNKQQALLNTRLKNAGLGGTILVYENLLDEYIKGEFDLIGIE